MTNLESEFCQLLDAQGLKPAAAAVVLRNWDPRVNKERTDYASQLAIGGNVDMVLAPYKCTDTLDEAKWTQRIVEKLGLARIIIVTHRFHHYRAYLTFIRVLGPGVEVLSGRIGTLVEDGEFAKIRKYQESGDIATYEEGICRLKLL